MRRPEASGGWGEERGPEAAAVSGRGSVPLEVPEKHTECLSVVSLCQVAGANTCPLV